jgi:hypothetical protein
MRVQTIQLFYPDDAHLECVIAPEVKALKDFCAKLGIDWKRSVLNIKEVV